MRAYGAAIIKQAMLIYLAWDIIERRLELTQNAADTLHISRYQLVLLNVQRHELKENIVLDSG